jgi:phosphoribosylformylglycinamidine synthase II
LTSSSVEIADKGGVGVEMDLDKVPQRETGMTAYEIMLSESQERMLMVLKPGQEHVAKRIFDKWDLDAEVIGKTTDTGRLVLKQHGQVVCDIPVPPLSQDAPNYDRPWNAPKPAPALDISKYPEPGDYGEVLLKLMSSPDMASKRWIWEQYDRHVMGDTIDSSQSGGDAAIVRIHGTNKALAITSDCNPHYVAADPYEGGKHAVAEAYRNLSAVGATPIAITDNLNFGNPEKPDTMGVIVKAIEGMAEACRALDFPVVSGNVSLYNETDSIGIPPTPVVGGIGLIEDVSKIATLKGAQAGDLLLLIGEAKGHMGASAYARVILGLDGLAAGAPARVDLEVEKRNAGLVRALIANGLVNAVHDVSDGGIACAAAEMALSSGTGVAIELNKERRGVTFLFGELQGCYLVSASADQLDRWETLEEAKTRYTKVGPPAIVARVMSAKSHFALPAIGQFGPDDAHDAEEAIRIYVGGDWAENTTVIPLATLRAAHEGWLPAYMKG